MSTLTLREYNHLQIHQKAVVICSESTLLDLELKKEVIYTLYAYGSFFIEVRVNRSTKDLLEIIGFKKGKKLDKYLDKISLPALING